MLKKEGDRLKSPVLSALATKVEGKVSDPFDKIKGLIQELIERLLAESEAEATKKGFCDTELGKAKKDRDFRMKDAKELNIELEALEIKKADLEAEIELLTDELDTLKDNLKTATEAREKEHGETVEQIKVAKEGLVAVKEAITILKVFYKNAAKAKSFIQASPVDEDTSGPGFKGNYAGNQDASKGIIGMLEVIHSDFDRTVRVTTAAEKKSHEEFTKFDRTSKADIASKTTKKDLDTEDLQTTDNSIDTKMEDLQTAVDLLDGALERLEELKPTCIDSGMSYAKRVEKREEEMAALKNALCILDTNNVESECA
jgi:chromosome segregation ATPase